MNTVSKEDIKKNAVKWQKIKIEILTPVHIGSGEQLDKDLDIVRKNNKTYLIDWNKFFQEESLENMENMLLKVKNNNISINDFSKKFLKEIKVIGDLRHRNMSLHIKNGLSGNPIIPGSSLKGWLVTLLFWKYLKEDTEKREQIKKMKKEWEKEDDEEKKKNLEKRLEKKLEKILGKFQASLMKHFRIPDIEFEETEWRISRRLNMSQNQRGVTVTLECISPGQSRTTFLGYEPEKSLWKEKNDGFTWKSSKEPLGKPLLTKAENTSEFWEQIFQWNNAFMQEYFEYELEYTHWNNEHKKKIDELLQEIPSHNKSTIVKLGKGMGYFIVTGNWEQLDENTPKTRSVFERTPFIPGFVKLTLLENQKNSLSLPRITPPKNVASSPKKEQTPIDLSSFQFPENMDETLKEKVARLKPFKKIKQNQEGEAIVKEYIGNRRHRVYVVIPDKEVQEVVMTGYNSELPPGTKVKVIITQIDRKKTITAVKFIKQLS